MATILPFPARPRAWATVGDAVRMPDGRNGLVIARHLTGKLLVDRDMDHVRAWFWPLELAVAGADRPAAPAHGRPDPAA